MSLWAIGLVVALVAFLIPIVVFALDSPLFRRTVPADPVDHEATELHVIDELSQRVRALEDEVDELSRAVRELRDDAQYLESLLERANREPPDRLAPPDS
jgi:TolA-binding protein